MLNPVPQQHAPGPAGRRPGGILSGTGPERIRTADFVQAEHAPPLPTEQAVFGDRGTQTESLIS